MAEDQAKACDHPVVAGFEDGRRACCVCGNEGVPEKMLRPPRLEPTPLDYAIRMARQREEWIAARMERDGVPPVQRTARKEGDG